MAESINRNLGIISATFFILSFFIQLVVTFCNNLSLRVIFVTFQTSFTKFLTRLSEILSKSDNWIHSKMILAHLISIESLKYFS